MTVAAVCCCHKIKKGRSQDRNRPLTCVELRGFEPLTPSMPWRCATSCATAPPGPDTDESDPTGPDIGRPHHQREEPSPCRRGDFDLTTEHIVIPPAHAL